MEPTSPCSERARPEPLILSRPSPAIMLERLNTIETCEVIAKIACTRSELLLDIDDEVLAYVSRTVFEFWVAPPSELVETGLKTPGRARKAMFAFNRTAA